ncbi:hypothetical protein EBS43_08020, partial [bacterium]|nr:hypothetical protein [bacterium]
IVGFPTETDEDFKKTIELLDRVQYDNIYAFAYSPRPGTRAAKMVDNVPAQVKNERLNQLLQHQLKIAEKRFAAQVGKVMEVLVEGEAKNQNLMNHYTKEDEKRGAEDVLSNSSRPELGLETQAAGAVTKARVWTGRTTCNRVVNFVSDSPRNLVGQFVQMKIIGSTRLSLQGELITGDLQ